MLQLCVFSASEQVTRLWRTEDLLNAAFSPSLQPGHYVMVATDEDSDDEIEIKTDQDGIAAILGALRLFDVRTLAGFESVIDGYLDHAAKH